MGKERVFEVDEALATRLGAAMERWSLSAVEPVADTPRSWVLRADSETGTHALKLLKPDGADEINGARLMQWWGGDGAAAITAIEGGDILMEWLDGETLADVVRADNGRDVEATEVVCEVVARLHRERAEPRPSLWPLDQWFAGLFDSDLAFLPAEARPQWRRAQALAKELLASTGEVVPLHGDLHHDNIVGGAGHWRAIDPKGLLGDPHYEVANI
ncbi:MAG: aminoglycoside phosphotransferase family protein, partial [Devosia sp.]